MFGVVMIQTCLHDDQLLCYHWPIIPSMLLNKYDEKGIATSVSGNTSYERLGDVFECQMYDFYIWGNGMGKLLSGDG